MSPERSHSSRLPTGFLLAVLALVCQLAFGALLPAEEASARQLAALDAVSVLCDGSAPTTPGHGAPHHHHAPDCALCPLCIAMAAHGAILASAPPLPTPTSEPVAQAAFPPPARAPPSRAVRIAFPRGPPVLT
jgi:hypothetical protein